MDLLADLIAVSGGIIFGLACLGFGIAVVVGGGSAWLGIALVSVGVATLAGSVLRRRRKHRPARV